MKWPSTSIERMVVALSRKVKRAAPGVGLPVLGCLLLLYSLARLGCTSPLYTFAPVTQSGVPSLQTAGDGALCISQSQNASDLERLTHLWDRRIHDGPLADYPIGPAGDVLEISIPAMEELKDRVVRVSGEGTIAPPLIGVVQARGLTEAEVRETIKHRLEAYMYAPQLNFFVRVRPLTAQEIVLSENLTWTTV
jgi:hypothetical protein